MLSDINRLTSVLKVISVQFIFILKDYRFLLFDLNVSNNSIMGVLGDVISVGLNGPSVDESSKRWLGDVFTVGFNGLSVEASSKRWLGDVITVDPNGPSVDEFIGYIYNL